VRSDPQLGSRFARMLAVFIAFGGGILGGLARADMMRDPSQIGDASRNPETLVEALVERWFAVLEDPSAELATVNDLLTEAPFDLLLGGELLRDRTELTAWVAKLRATYPRIAYELGPIQIQSEGIDLYRVHFEFDRNAVDSTDLPHVARREQTWIVRSDSVRPPVILSIEERPLLFFSGTGPQIVCY